MACSCGKSGPSVTIVSCLSYWFMPSSWFSHVLTLSFSVFTTPLSFLIFVGFCCMKTWNDFYNETHNSFILFKDVFNGVRINGCKRIAMKTNLHHKKPVRVVALVVLMWAGYWAWLPVQFGWAEFDLWLTLPSHSSWWLTWSNSKESCESKEQLETWSSNMHRLLEAIQLFVVMTSRLFESWAGLQSPLFFF